MTDNPKIFDITTVGHQTRFGAGQDASAAGKRAREMTGSNASVRAALRRIGTLECDIERTPTAQEILDCFGSNGRKITMNQRIALRKYMLAVAGDVKAMQQIEDSIDGKLANTTITTDMPLSELVAAARKELRDEQRRDSQD